MNIFMLVDSLILFYIFTLMLTKLKLKYSKKPLRGDIYNLRNLKVITDEILVDYMKNVLNYKINNLYTDFTLAVGIISTILASILAYLSMNYEFDEYKTFLIVSLSIYFLLNSIVYMCDMCRTTTYQCKITAKDNNQDIQIRVCTDITPPNPVYTILLYKNNRLIPEKWSKSVFDLFDVEGVLQADDFLNEVDTFFNKK